MSLLCHYNVTIMSILNNTDKNNLQFIKLFNHKILKERIMEY